MKYLGQIDAQSLEIERLFLENEGLRDSVKESNGVSARWDRQVSPPQ
jgi:hypothetical protein